MGYAEAIGARQDAATVTSVLVVLMLALPASALELSGVREIRMETEGRLIVTQGDDERATANKSGVLMRQEGTTLVIGPTVEPEGADAIGPADLEVVVVVADLADRQHKRRPPFG